MRRIVGYIDGRPQWVDEGTANGSCGPGVRFRLEPLWREVEPPPKKKPVVK
jgi:hypothetical protein